MNVNSKSSVLVLLHLHTHVNENSMFWNAGLSSAFRISYANALF